MQSSFRRTRAIVFAGLCAAGILAAPSHAHEAGDVILKVGVSTVSPRSNNGRVADDSIKLGINDNSRPSFSVTYMATRNIGIDLLAAVPFKHDISGRAGGANIGKIGETKHLPPTLSVQWHFLPDSTIQPYVGLGVNYTKFFNTKTDGALYGNDLELKDSWGLAGQIGVDIKLSERWMLTADVRYIDIDSKVSLNGERIGTAKIDPWVGTVGVGYRF